MSALWYVLVGPVTILLYLCKDNYSILDLILAYNIYSFTVGYGVPLRSKYPDSEMLFQKQKYVQNMYIEFQFIW